MHLISQSSISLLAILLTMRPKILVIAAVPKQGLEELEQKCDLIYPTEGFLFSDDEIKEHVREADGVLSVFTRPFTAEMMEEAPRLKIIANFGVGYNNIDVAKATEMGVVVCNTPNAVTEPTGEVKFIFFNLSSSRTMIKSFNLRLNLSIL